MNRAKLAINGGTKVRERPMPYRRLFGEEELESVVRVFHDSWRRGQDFGYQGKYEKLYTDKFCEFQGGGFADAVSSGTAAIYLALKALDIKLGSDVIVSPVTDPGSVAPIIIAGMNPVVADSRPNSFNIGPDEFEEALTSNTRAAILSHIGGHPIDMEPILEIVQARGIKIIEDCSQAHGALYKGKRVGRFGDMAAFSTMFSKNHATGGCGGLVYTEKRELYWRARSYADRGKPFDKSDFNPKDPRGFLFPSLNFNQDELSCAIGLSTLAKLQDTIDRRLEIAQKINNALEASKVVHPVSIPEYAVPSLFFLTFKVDTQHLKVSKEQFAQAVAAEGALVNPDYKYVVAEWDWIKKFFNRKTLTPNAVQFRKETFNLLFNERFTDADIEDIIACILKVESVLAV